jgi:hypothetical protein
MPKLVVQNLPPDSAENQNKNIDALVSLPNGIHRSCSKAQRARVVVNLASRNREASSRVHTSLPTRISAPSTPEIFPLKLFF